MCAAIVGKQNYFFHHLFSRRSGNKTSRKTENRRPARTELTSGIKTNRAHVSQNPHHKRCDDSTRSPITLLPSAHNIVSFTRNPPLRHSPPPPQQRHHKEDGALSISHMEKEHKRNFVRRLNSLRVFTYTHRRKIGTLLSEKGDELRMMTSEHKKTVQGTIREVS